MGRQDAVFAFIMLLIALQKLLHPGADLPAVVRVDALEPPGIGVLDHLGDAQALPHAPAAPHPIARDIQVTE